MKDPANIVAVYQKLPRLFYCGDFIIRGGWKLGPRIIQEYEVVYFPAGSRSTYTVYGNVIPLEEPCFILTPPGVSHAYYFDAEKPIRHLFCHFTLPPDTDLPIGDVPDFLKAESVPHVPSFLKQILVAASTMHPRFEERISALLLAMLEELAVAAAAPGSARDEKAVPPKLLPFPIMKVLAHIDEHLYEPIAINELAVLSGWSHEHFTRMFVRSLGLSPKQYILQNRIDRACEMLCLQNSSIKEIAYAVGFQSEQYFSRAFMKMVGICASDYRARHSDPKLLNLHLAPSGDVTAPYPLNRMFRNPNKP